MSACVLFRKMFSISIYTFIFLLLYIPNSVISTAKLNVPRVLLPVFQDLSINFTLEISGGSCYQWSTTRPDLIKIEALHEGQNKLLCSKYARITVLSREMTKKTAIVYAQSLSMDETLRADVILDVITTLKIITKSRELYMEEPPQMFEVRAYDLKGNEFTTLEGVEFKWSVQSISDSRISFMRLMTFSESPYETPSSISSFDSIGKHGHIVLLEGIKTGSAKVITQLPHAEYNNVPPAVVQLVVIANLVVEPSHVYILPDDTISFKLYQVRQGKHYEISPLNEQFMLVSGNNHVAEVEGRKAKGKALGKVEVMVRDRYIPDNETIKLPSALVIVTEPQYMTLTILPFNTWTLTIGLEAVIIPEVFEINGHKITLGAHSVIHTKVPDDIFKLTSDNKNGTVVGTAYKSGSGKVISQLHGHTLFNIGAESVLDVYPNVALTPEVLVLPWVAEYTPKLLGYSLAVSGGDNNYEWSSNETSIVQVSQDGFLKFIGPGSTTVSVCMRKNKNSSASAIIHLLPPEEIKIFHEYAEAFIGEHIFLNIILYGRLRNNNSYERVQFDMCSFINFDIRCTEPFIQSSISNENVTVIGCATKAVKAQDFGIGKVKVSLKTTDRELSAVVSLAAHKPLMFLQPLLRENVILSFEAYYDLVLTGGPSSVFGPLNTLTSFSQKVLNISVQTLRPYMYVFRVYCKNIGPGYFKLKLTTKPFGYHGITTIKRIEINCNIPRTMEIISSSDCSSSFSQRIITYTFTKMAYYVNVYDDQGQPFQNATSVSMKWAFDNQSIARFDPDDGLKLMEVHHPEYISGSNHFVVIKTFQYFADVYGRAWALGYKSRSSNALQYAKEHFLGKASEIISFILSIVQEPTVSPQSLSILNHPSNFALVKISGGSGQFSFEPTSKIVSIHYDYQTRRAELEPLTEGKCEIIVRDKCLPEEYALKIDVQVVSVSIVKLSSPLKIQEGQHIKVTVRVLDKDEKPLEFPNLTRGKLGFKMGVSDSSIAEFDSLKKANIDYLKGSIDINLKGKKLGHTSIWASWLDIASNIEHIQVFPKIKISPRNITLAVGSETQLTVTGGPSLDSVIHFLIGDAAITSVSNDAIVKGIRPGKTPVTAVSMSHEGEVYSKDVIDVLVIPLSGVHIIAPTTTLGVGNSMPVWASGIPSSITPILLGSITPSLQFKWHYSVPNIIQIRDTLHNTNVQVLSENKLSVRVLALNPGRTQLQLEVAGRGHDKAHFVLNSSLVIEVRNKLAWSKPSIDYSPLLMAPNTVFNVKGNTLDKEFKIIRSTDIWSLNTGQPLLNVNSDGMVKTNTNVGTSIIYARSFGTDVVKDIALSVEVSEVHYLMINIATTLETSEVVKTLPRGLYLNMTITYHDQFGYEFSVPPLTKPIALCNICSKIHIEYVGSNHSIITSLVNPGNIVLRVHDNVHHRDMEDYIKIPVDNYILPQKTHFTVGEVVCFWTPLVSLSGVWTSDDNAMDIKKEGIGIAMRTGSSIITYSISSPEPVVLTSVNVEILPLLSFLIGPVANNSISNIANAEYFIPVFLINEKQKKEPSYYKHCNSSVKLHVNPPFHCDLHYTSVSKLYPITHVFLVSSSFNYDMGSYVCSISTIKGATPETSIIESNLTLTVSSPNSGLYETLFLNFYPQFYVNVDKIYFSRDINFMRIKISGSSLVLASIFIGKSDHKFIALDRPHFEPNLISFLVKRTELHEKEGSVPFENVFLHLTSQLTSQDLKIPMFYEDKETSPGIIMSIIYVLWYTLCDSFSVFSVVLTAIGILIVAICLSLRYIPHFEVVKEPSPGSGFSKSFNPPVASSPLPRHSGGLLHDENVRPYARRPGQPLLASSKFLRSTRNVRNLMPDRGLNTSLDSINPLSSSEDEVRRVNASSSSDLYDHTK